MYQYTGCGLDNILLADGYREHETPYGRSVAVEDVQGLHRAIAESIVDSKPTLSGKEFRFLRLELEMSQKRIGEIIGAGAQAIAIWEKKDKVTKSGDHFIRYLYKRYTGGDPDIVALIDRLNSLDKDNFHKNVEFKYDQENTIWKKVA